MHKITSSKPLAKVWPQIVAEQQDEDQVTLQLVVSEDLDYFQGHFPQAPILAGVVQLHWAVEYAKSRFDLHSFDVKNTEVLKFQVVIVPGQLLTLTLTKKSANKVLFSYQSNKDQHASGRIVFEG